MQVTQTSVSAGHFEAKLYHMVFEEEFARFKVGHSVDICSENIF